MSVGALIAQSAALTGATLHFIAGRYLFKDKLFDMASKYPTFKAVNKAIDKEVLNHKLFIISLGFQSYFHASFVSDRAIPHA